MAQNTPLSGIPYPDAADIDLVPIWMAGLALEIDDRVVLRAVDIADRTARFSGVDKGAVCTTENGGVYVKLVTATNTWYVVNEPPETWRTIPLTSGIIAYQQTPLIRRIGNQVWIQGGVQKSDSTDFIAQSTGQSLFTVPADCQPTRSQKFAIANSLSGTNSAGTSKVEMAAASRIMNRYSQETTAWLWFAINYWID